MYNLICYPFLSGSFWLLASLLLILTNSRDQDRCVFTPLALNATFGFFYTLLFGFPWSACLPECNLPAYLALGLEFFTLTAAAITFPFGVLCSISAQPRRPRIVPGMPGSVWVSQGWGPHGKTVNKGLGLPSAPAAGSLQRDSGTLQLWALNLDRYTLQ